MLLENICEKLKNHFFSIDLIWDYNSQNENFPRDNSDIGSLSNIGIVMPML